MTKERNNLKAGLFIVVSVALIIAVVIGIKGIGTIIAQLETRQVVFSLSDDVSGLAVGDPVRIGGVKVGSVEDISFEEIKDGVDPKVVVEFSIPSKFKLREDARVTIQGTITGTTWLNVDTLGKGNVATASTLLTGRPSNLSVLLASLGDASPELTGVLRDVRTTTVPKANGLIDKVTSKIDPAYDKYAGLADAGASALGNVRDITGDIKTDFRGTIANLNATTGQLKDKLPNILTNVDGLTKKLVATIDNAQGAVEDLKSALSNTKELTGSARTLLLRNRGKLDDLVASLKSTGDNLKAASAEIRHSPWRLLYKPGPGEMGNLNLYDAARQFAEGAGDLNDAAVSLRDAAQDPTVKPEDLQKLLDRLDASFVEFKQVEQKLWTSVKQ